MRLKQPIIAVDTGIILAYGFGERIDSKAPQSIVLFEILQELGITPILLTSVNEELKIHREELDSIMVLLKKIINDYPESNTSPVDPLTLEKVMTRIRKRDRLRRFVDAVEEEIFTLYKEAPQAPMNAILAELLGRTNWLIEGIETRIDSLDIHDYQITWNDKDLKRFNKKGIGKMDRKHLITCQMIGEKEKNGVLFLVYENPIQSYKMEIQRALPRVRVSNPRYIDVYLDQDASKWK